MPIVLIPVVREIIADTETPISIYSKLKEYGARFLLESAERGESFGRWSIIALCPDGAINVLNSIVRLSGELKSIVKRNDPAGAVRDTLAAYSVENADDLPPFIGGVAGFFSYDCIRYIENLPNAAADDAGFPDMQMYLFTQVLVYDHLKHTLKYIRLIKKSEASAENIDAIKKDMDKLLSKLDEGKTLSPAAINISQYKSHTNIGRQEYKDAVEKAKAYIREGDIFQVVLSRRRMLTPAPDPYEVYRRLRSINPSPYMYYLDFDGYQVVGSSPECLTRVTDGMVETFPIAGTRPRGETPEEDKRLAEELLADEKELAEHCMLVDLGRNDIGKISEFGSVEVLDYMHIEQFSHVMHIVTKVRGKLKAGFDGVDAIMSCLPAGTVSGAPKIRAMEIIDELEPTRRGPYAGAVGYFDFRGNMDMCITIRTLLFKGGCVYAQAGGGIVADSVADKEYDETENKLGALLKALGTDYIPVNEQEGEEQS